MMMMMMMMMMMTNDLIRSHCAQKPPLSLFGTLLLYWMQEMEAVSQHRSAGLRWDYGCGDHSAWDFYKFFLFCYQLLEVEHRLSYS